MLNGKSSEWGAQWIINYVWGLYRLHCADGCKLFFSSFALLWFLFSLGRGLHGLHGAEG